MTLSYLVLEVHVVDARTKDLGRDTAWYKKLEEARSKATAVSNNPNATDDQRKKCQEDCQELIGQADLLISDDSLYLPSEAINIIRTSYIGYQYYFLQSKAR